MLTIEGDLVDVRTRKLVSSDIGVRIVFDLDPGSDVGALHRLMGHPLRVTIEVTDQKEAI